MWRFCFLVASVLCFAAQAAAQDHCAPLPNDFQVVFHVDHGSASALAKVMACLLGFEVTTGPKSAVTVLSDKPISINKALKKVQEAFRKNGLSLRQKGRTLSVVCARKCEGPEGKEVRVEVIVAAREVKITTDPVKVSRSVLEEPDASRRLGENHFAVSDRLRQLALENPLAFASEAEAWPNWACVPECGFFIVWLRPGGIFDRLGLKTGDLITEVNGRRVGSIAEAIEAYGALKESRSLLVRILRNGKPLALKLDFITFEGN